MTNSNSRSAKAAFELLESRRLLSSTAGALDPTFGLGGIAKLNSTDDISIEDAAIQTDGKILAAGSLINSSWDDSTNSSIENFVLARFNPDGSPDTSFGTGGFVTAGPAGTDNEIHRILVQPDGKILAAGVSDGDFAIARYNADGSLDTSFGHGGIRVTNMGGDDSITGLALQENKIIAVGSSSDSIAVIRYDENGAIDSSFGTGGSVITASPASDMLNGSINANAGVAVLDDGRILAVGNQNTDDGSSLALVYYKSNGTLASIKLGPEQSSSTDISSFALLSGGKVLTIGGSDDSGFSLERHNANGSLDTTFGDNGAASGPLDSGTSLAVQSDGKIVVSGVPDGMESAAIARFNADGSIDDHFGIDGEIGTSALNDSGPVLVQSNGNIVTVSDAVDDNDLASAVAAVRFMSDVGVKAPSATMTSSDLTNPGQSDVFLHVTYRSDSGIDQSSLGDWNLQITDSNGDQLPVTLGDIAQNADGSITAEYTVQKDYANHNFNANDNGTYTVEITNDQVIDNTGLGVPDTQLGKFHINIAPPPGGIHAPTALLTSNVLSDPAVVEQSFDVSFRGDAPIDEASLGDGNIIVTAPDGSQLATTFVSATDHSDGSVTAHYTVQKYERAQFTDADNGAYTVAIQDGEVSDNEGTTVLAANIGSFHVTVAHAPPGTAPTATLRVSDISGNDTTAVLFVTFKSQNPLAKQTLDDNDLNVTGPDGSSRTASFISASQNSDGSTTAQYQVEFGGFYPFMFASSGSISAPTTTLIASTGTSVASSGALIRWPIFGFGNVNGTYNVSLQPGQVSDTQGRTADAIALGTFKVNITTNPPVYGPILALGGIASDTSIAKTPAPHVTNPAPTNKPVHHATKTTAPHHKKKAHHKASKPAVHKHKTKTHKATKHHIHAKHSISSHKTP